MSIGIKGGSDGNLLEVSNTGVASVNFPTDQTKSGFAALAAESDAGSITGNRLVRAAKANEDYALTTGVSNILFNCTTMAGAAGGTWDSNLWKQASDTMTIAVLNDSFMINDGANTTDAKYMIVTSYKTFPNILGQTLYVQFKLAVTNSTATQKVGEAGLGYLATTAAPTDGYFFRWDTDGSFKAVSVHNSVEQTATIASTSKPLDGEYHYYLISITPTTAQFWIDDIIVASITSTNTLAQITRASSHPLNFRVRNVVGASAAMRMMLGHAIVDSSGAPFERPYSHIQAALGQNCNQGQPSRTAIGTQSNWSNTPTIASATLTNTAVPSGGYTGTSLGGLFQFAAHVPGATPVNNIIFGYNNLAAAYSAGTPTIQDKSLYITDLAIYACSTGAAVATTATIIQWGLVYGSHNLGNTTTGVSQVTAEAATTKAPRRLALGYTSWVVGAAQGVPAKPIIINFTTPIAILPGQWCTIIEATVVGTATANQLILGTVMLNGYWE